mmetsp:Transcript_49139/g.107068  ORF Transcript_49139/g.107068 Transcript_49139/m.107068 type:complete len:245 (-) Transcript_49139:98-832(-)
MRRQPTPEYGGVFKGLGTMSKDPTVRKGTHWSAKFQTGSQFSIGTNADDPEGRKRSTTHRQHSDPLLLYERMQAPYKNASVVQLEQGDYRPDVHFETEQRGRFAGTVQPRQEAYDPPTSQVHFGDYEYSAKTIESQYMSSHTDPQTGEPYDKNSSGVPSGPEWSWDPINGGAPLPSKKYSTIRRDFRQPSANWSNVPKGDRLVRNPIMGVYDQMTAPPKAIDVNDTQRTQPPLASLAALRPYNP